MTIKKLIEIKNAGRIRSYNAKGDVEFKKFTLIFGENGRGKTTLCAILRSVQDGDSSHILGRKTLGVTGVPSIHLQLGATQIYFKDANWTQTVPHIMIFDQDFISENVYAGNIVGTDQRRNLYKLIIGKDGVLLAEKFETQKSEITNLTKQITNLDKIITTHLQAGLTVKTFLSSPINASADELINAAETELTAGKEAAVILAHKSFTALKLPELPSNLEEILSISLETISAEVERKVKEHITLHKMGKGGQTWISDGLKFENKNECPFCGQEIDENELVNSYKKLFTKEYADLKASLIKQGVEISELFGDAKIQELIGLIAENKTSGEFWKRYCTNEELPAIETNNFKSTINDVKEATLSLMRIKANNPLEIVSIDQTLKDAKIKFADLLKTIKKYNECCNSNNEIIQARKRSVTTVNISLLQDNLNKFTLLKKRHEEPLLTICNENLAYQKQKQTLEAERETLKSQLDATSDKTVKVYQDSINKYLDKFNAGFKIADVDHNYIGGVNANYYLSINNTSIKLGDDKTPKDQASFKNTLSSGDKSTLALAFFLAQIEHDKNKAQKIIVFDDPFNSQDSFRKNQTAIEIGRIGSGCAQTIVLSHDPAFLKQVKDKIYGAPVKCLHLIPASIDNSHLIDLDLESLLQPEMKVLTDKLQIFYSDSKGDPNDIVKKIRPLLEGYCRNSCISLFSSDEMLSEILTKIKLAGDAHPLSPIYDELNDINDYTCRHHHADGSVTHIIDSGELQGYTKRTLRIVGAL